MGTKAQKEALILINGNLSNLNRRIRPISSSPNTLNQLIKNNQGILISKILLDSNLISLIPWKKNINNFNK